MPVEVTVELPTVVVREIERLISESTVPDWDAFAQQAVEHLVGEDRRPGTAPRQRPR